MHQSGHSRAHNMQTVQFSSSSAITPRLRGGSSGSTSGYCWVIERLVIVFSVTASPLIRPWPGAPRSPSSLTNAYPAPSPIVTRAHPSDILPSPVCRGCAALGDLDGGGQHQLRQGDRDEDQPAQALQLV